MERKTLKGIVFVGMMAAILLPVASFGFSAPHNYRLPGAGSDSWSVIDPSEWNRRNWKNQFSDDKKTLEWIISQGSLPTDYNNWSFAGVTRIDGGTGDSARLNYADINCAPKTPIPNAAWLLGSGLIGLIGLKRRNNKKSKG